MLFHNLAGVAIPADLAWEDRRLPTHVVQTERYTLAGTLVVQAAKRSAGQLVTLRAKNPDMGWVDFSTVSSLFNLATDPGAIYTLTLADGETLRVSFTGARIAVEPVDYPAHDTGEARFYRVELFLMVA